MAAHVEKHMCNFKETNVINKQVNLIRCFCDDRNINYRKLNVCRQSRHLRNGDFTVPKGCMGELSSEDVSSLQDRIMAETQTSLLPVGRLSQDQNHTVILFVDRPKAYRNVITRVLQQGDKYGKTTENSCHLVLLNSADVAAASADTVSACSSTVPNFDAIRNKVDDLVCDVCCHRSDYKTESCESSRTSALRNSASVCPVSTVNPSSFDDHNMKRNSSSTDHHVKQNSDSLADTNHHFSDDGNISGVCSPVSGFHDNKDDIVIIPNDVSVQASESSIPDVCSLTSGCCDNEDVVVSETQCIAVKDSERTCRHCAQVIRHGCKTPLTLACLRAAVILQHTTLLLEANGYPVKQVPCVSSSSLLRLFENLGSELRHSEINSKTLSSLIRCAETSPFRHHITTSATTTQPGLDEDGDFKESEKKSKTVVIDLQKFIHNTEIIQGKRAYNKNLHYADVNYPEGPSDVFLHVARLEDCLNKEIHQTKTITCIHMVSENSAFIQQQIDLIWKMFSTHSVKQSHLVMGSVICRKEGKEQCHITTEEFFRLRNQQIKLLSDMKYGDDLDSEWESTLMRLTSAVIKFEMLNTACRNKLKLDVSQQDDGGPGAETRSGLFVVYNCARLATLFRHFQQEVQKGVYPELPSISSINFELLREEEEWTLLFNFVSVYPDVVQNSVEDIDPHNSDIYAKIHTHKVVNFLTSLSRNLSSYYGRVHILGEGKPHLFPVMFARLYLMKAVHQILINGLSLLGIQPFSQI